MAEPCARCGAGPALEPEGARVGAGGMRAVLCTSCILLGPLTPEEAARYRARLAEENPETEEES